MPPRRKQLPSYCRHAASGQAVVRLDGRDIYLGSYGSPESRAEYDRLVAEWLLRRREGVAFGLDVRCEEITINELLAQFLCFAKTYYVKNGEPTGELRNLKDSVIPVVRLYGTTRVKEFGPLRLRTVREAMIEQGLCRRVINDRVKRIRRVFRWGVEQQIVTPDILHALQALSPLKRGRCAARETKPVLPVPKAHIDSVLAAITPMVATMIRLQLLTGMRPGEVCIMRACDLDMSGDVWLYRPFTHKTEHFGSERVVLIGPQAQEILREELTASVQAFVFSPRRAVRERHAACRTHRRKPPAKPKTRRRLGNRYDTRSYGMAIRYACRKAGVPCWSPNRLRHNAATEVRKQFGLDVAQVVLGHKTAKVTQVYAELDLAKAQAAIRRIG